jgi:hypothetical protein
VTYRSGLLLGGRGLLGQFQTARVSGSAGEDAPLGATLDGGFELNTSADHATTILHGGKVEMRRVGGAALGWPYLTFKCWSGDLEVALDVFLDGLTRGPIAFFELRNQPVIKP